MVRVREELISPLREGLLRSNPLGQRPVFSQASSMLLFSHVGYSSNKTTDMKEGKTNFVKVKFCFLKVAFNLAIQATLVLGPSINHHFHGSGSSSEGRDIVTNALEALGQVCNQFETSAAAASHF